jgi:hypothetical protein
MKFTPKNGINNVQKNVSNTSGVHEHSRLVLDYKLGTAEIALR